MARGDGIGRIVVVGAGLMGHGIAQGLAVAGRYVVLHDLTEEKLRKAIQEIRANLQRLRAVGLATDELDDAVLARLDTRTALAEAVAEADLVIECAYEDLAQAADVRRA